MCAVDLIVGGGPSEPSLLWLTSRGARSVGGLLTKILGGHPNMKLLTRLFVDSVDNYYRVELGGRRNKAIGRFGYI